jgi:uncharacterized membrane protein
MKIVLAYSGGLDTSVLLAWLKETYQAEIIAFCADVGQEEELDGLEEKATRTGASKIYIDNLCEEFARDFIFPMIGEELGLRCTWLVVFGFILIILCAGLIAANAKDRFGKLLAMGILLLISLQAAVNIGMTTSLLPNKGMPLPFISYGGSNLAISLFMIGILVNIHRIGTPVITPSDSQVILAGRSVPRI